MRCFACGKKMKRRFIATTIDDQTVSVGVDCWNNARKSWDQGYQPPKGGPKIYLHIAIGKTIDPKKV